MDDSLLVSLRRYRPREGRDSLEDFVTEIFAWLLSHSKPVSDAVLQTVLEHLPADRQFDLPEDDQDISWKTQVPYPGSRLDMLARWPGVAILFEHKVHAPLSRDQLQRYRDIADHQFSGHETYLVVISGNRGQHRPEADACLCWHHIYQALDTLNQALDSPTDSYHIASFLALLRHEGLHPAAPIAHQAIVYYPVAGKLPNKLHDAFSPLAQRDYPLTGNYQGSMCGLRWGRLGIQLTPVGEPLHWMPGIFAGVVLDGADHLITHRHPDQVMLRVILDFSRKLHVIYPTLDSYQHLVGVLRESTVDTRWDLYNHLGEESSFNRWHPLHLETPLLEVLRGTQTMDQQREAIYEAVCEALRLLDQNQRLQALTADCRASLTITEDA